MRYEQPAPELEPTDPLQELAFLFAQGYLRLCEQRSEGQRVNQRGGERCLDVPGERSVHGPAVNAAGDANHPSPHHKGATK